MASVRTRRSAARSPGAELGFTTEQVNRNVFKVRIPYIRKKGWEKWFLLSSDRHWDNPHSDHKLQKEHLEEARERKAGVFDFGDFGCLMQGKYDPRASKRDIRPEHNVANYLDAVVNTAADFFEPYATLFQVIGMGNHETAILKRAETNFTDRLIGILNHRTGSHIKNGGYTGWVKFLFSHNGSGRHGVNLHYEHGYGGGGPVTKGTIQTNRRAVYLPDANIVVSGHIHERWQMDIERVRLNDVGEQYCDTQVHVQLPTYKEEYQDGFGGYHIENGRPPKPIGAAWLRFYWCSRTQRVQYQIQWAQ